MANYFTLTLDTTGPAGVSISIEGGATYATSQLVTCTIGTTDGTTTNYQMKIWGDVDTTYNASIKDTEANSAWITFATSQQVKLSAAEGSKTLYVKIRDDVYNESSQASDNITLDLSIPVVSIGTPDTTKISKITGKNVCSFTWQADVAFVEYTVRVVSASGSAHDTGTQIGTTGGSTNTSGATGSYAAATNITTTIYGADLESASSGDGAKIIKVFVKESAGNWSA